MAESVDALVSNTSGAIRAGSTPAPGTRKRVKYWIINYLTLFIFEIVPKLFPIKHSYTFCLG